MHLVFQVDLRNVLIPDLPAEQGQPAPSSKITKMVSIREILLQFQNFGAMTEKVATHLTSYSRGSNNFLVTKRKFELPLLSPYHRGGISGTLIKTEHPPGSILLGLYWAFTIPPVITKCFPVLYAIKIDHFLITENVLPSFSFSVKKLMVSFSVCSSTFAGCTSESQEDNHHLYLQIITFLESLFFANTQPSQVQDSLLSVYSHSWVSKLTQI